MRLRRLKIESSSACGGLFDGLDLWFGRDARGNSNEPLAPLCLIGPNGSGKSQFLQLLAEIFQSAWHEHAPREERRLSNSDALFELTYLVNANEKIEEATLVRKKKGGRPGPIEIILSGREEPLKAGSEEFGKCLPSIVVGYTSGDNETLSLPFLVSRSGYADDVARSALKGSADGILPDNRLMLIDYGTNLEVVFSNLMLGARQAREEILRHASLSDIASCRCIVRLAHSAAPTAPLKRGKAKGRKGIQLTDELEEVIRKLKGTATCWHEDERTETYIFDFFVNKSTRDAFAHFWENALSLYKSLHKLALLNDLVIPKVARNKFARAVEERRFASKLPEPQQEDMVFSFEEVRFWPLERKKGPVDYVTLSDGEHQQALILATYAMITDENALFLLDEPESHFNPQWRVKFVKRLLDLTGNRKNQEVLLTSHAPFVPSDLPREQVLIFSREGDKIGVKSPEIETYGATFDRILDHCFDIRPPISGIANEEIDALIKNGTVDQIREAMDRLGSSVEKAFLADRLSQLEKRN